MQKRARPDFGLLRGWTGGLILRPWFDWLAVRAVANWYLPLSRAWAAGAAARGSVTAFAEATGINVGALPRLPAVLTKLDERRRVRDAAQAQWEDAFFGDDDTGGDALTQAEARRLATSMKFMATRASLFSVRRMVPRIAWDVASPAAVEAMHAARLEGMASAFPPPPARTIGMSRTIDSRGRIEGWIRMPSPSRVIDDVAWARVFRPAEGPVRGAIVSLHGIFMEQDAWAMADPVTDLVDQGFCIVRPEGPWHGRRCPLGEFGGERIFAEGILGFVNVFESWVAETALWIRWARAEVGGPVGLAGISMGALTAQLVVSACASWPADRRPDAALLITTTDDIVEGAFRGSLTSSVRVEEQLWAAGWNRDEIHRWAPLLEPADTPAIDPAKIVMALGDADTVTPFAGGRAFAESWGIPSQNLLVKHQGHFSTALGLYRDSAPLLRLAEIMTAAG